MRVITADNLCELAQCKKKGWIRVPLPTMNFVSLVMLLPTMPWVQQISPILHAALCVQANDP